MGFRPVVAIAANVPPGSGVALGTVRRSFALIVPSGPFPEIVSMADVTKASAHAPVTVRVCQVRVNVPHRVYRPASGALPIVPAGLHRCRVEEVMSVSKVG